MKILLHEHIDNVELFVGLCDFSQRQTALRHLIGQDYQSDPHGRPVVPGMSLSVTHTDSFLALAMASHGRVGIDAEPIYEGTFDPAPAGLSEEEHEYLSQLPEHDRALAFTKIWTAKEALSKAIGLGLALEFSQLEILPGSPDFQIANTRFPGWNLTHRQLIAGGREIVIALVSSEN